MVIWNWDSLSDPTNWNDYGDNTMKCFIGENTVFIDVDNTLVMYEDDIHEDSVHIKDPYSDQTLTLRPHKCHIRLLKNCKQQGKEVVVWSAQGWKWAETVVKALHLEDHVNLCMGKPHIIVDDKPWAEWPIANLYLKGGFGK